jgi:hypothetical protein
MSEVTRYRKPFPQVTEHRSFDGESCDAEAPSAHPTRHWCCTRVAGHPGQHEAGGPRGQMYASWPAEVAG